MTVAYVQFLVISNNAKTNKQPIRLVLDSNKMFPGVVCFQSEAQKQLEEIKSLREKMKEVADEARGKEDLYKQLVIFGYLTRYLEYIVFAFPS